jgi:hypothetical protein
MIIFCLKDIPVAYPQFVCTCLTSSISLFIALYLFYDLGNEKRENKKPYGEENLKGYQLFPVAGGPYIFYRPDEKGEDKRTHDNAQAGSRNIVPESDFGESHAKVHGRKWKVKQPKI